MGVDGPGGGAGGGGGGYRDPTPAALLAATAGAGAGGGRGSVAEAVGAGPTVAPAVRRALIFANLCAAVLGAIGFPDILFRHHNKI